MGSSGESGSGDIPGDEAARPGYSRQGVAAVGTSRSAGRVSGGCVGGAPPGVGDGDKASGHDRHSPARGSGHHRRNAASRTVVLQRLRAHGAGGRARWCTPARRAMMTAMLRPATPGDRPDLIALALAEDAAWSDAPAVSEDEVGEFLDRYGTGVIAERGGRAAGYAAVDEGGGSILLVDPGRPRGAARRAGRAGSASAGST